ncbi:MAG TPA: GAF domain-containing protein [Bryobacteraceae bacterium]|nr:GAF domain-containing protein [Bryobacteraceae bacterium]
MAGCLRFGQKIAVLGLWLLTGVASAETSISPEPPATLPHPTLAQINQRVGANFASAYDAQTVVLRGVVNGPAIHFPEYTAIAIQDSEGGAILASPAPKHDLDVYHPGNELRVIGVISQRMGMPVVLPQSIELLGQKPVPAPVSITLRDLAGFKYLGRLVRTEGRVKSVSATMSGPLITLAGAQDVWVFLAREQGQPTGEFAAYDKGDTVEATGIASQYCPRPPYNHSFEVLAPVPESVVRKERGLGYPAVAAVLGASALIGIAVILWGRERRVRTQRERLRKIYQLGEEIVGAGSPEAIRARLSEALPAILAISRVHLYLHNRAAKTLDGVAEESEESASIPLATTPPAGTQSGAAACFHYRTLLVIPDVTRSPFPITSAERSAPKSLLFVPMMAQGEVIGVMELDQDDRMRDFTADEQALAQHLGNQIGAALRLLAQRTVQTQLFRTEKMAAVGRLISGVVNELQTPLASITELANLALGRDSLDSAERDLKAISAEAQKASGIVARLVSYAAAEQSEARPVSVGGLLRTLIEFREGDWKASGIRLTESISREPLNVLGSQGQLEQVFLNLLVHAEQSLSEAPRKMITIRTSVLAKRLLVEISFSAAPESSRPEEAASILSVTRGVVAGHGGEVRLIEKSNADPRFEVDLPLVARERPASASSATPQPKPDAVSQKTALVIESDEGAQRQLIALLSARGFRVVPLNNADNGLDLAQRVRFDAAFCSVHAPGLNWVELSERMHSRVGGFVLLSEGYDSELAADFEGDGRFVLPKPVQETELDRVLRALETSLKTTKVVNIRNNSVA